MLSTKIRTVIALAATFGAVAAVAPFAPEASAAIDWNQHWEFCHQMKQEYEQGVETYVAAEGKGKKAMEGFEEAVSSLQAAEKAGCGWAEGGRVHPPTKGITPATPAGTHPGSTPEGGTVRPPTSTPVGSVH